MTLLAAAGFLFAPRPGVRLFVLAYLALTMAEHVLILVVWRYRIPYWDPVLLLYGGSGAFLLAESLARRAGIPLAARVQASREQP
jgi:hypothetical protein